MPDAGLFFLLSGDPTGTVLGFLLLRYIDVKDSESVLRAIYLTDPNGSNRLRKRNRFPLVPFRHRT